MTTRVRVLVGLLPLAACVLSLRATVPAVRSQQNTAGTQRQRAHRQVRGNVRIDGDHHHEEVPHLQFQLTAKSSGGGAADPDVSAPETFAWRSPQAISEFAVLFQASPAPSGVPLSRSGRSPPFSV